MAQIIQIAYNYVFNSGITTNIRLMWIINPWILCEKKYFQGNANCY